VLFLAVFGATGALLIGYLYWQTAGYLSSRVDAALVEQTARWSLFDAEKLLRELNGHAARDPASREPYGLFSATGRSVAGAIDSVRLVREFDRPFDFSLNGPDGKPQPMRGMAHVLDDGRVLLLTRDISSVGEFDELMVRAIRLRSGIDSRGGPARSGGVGLRRQAPHRCHYAVDRAHRRRPFE